MDKLKRAEKEMIKMWNDHYDWLISKSDSKETSDIFNQFREEKVKEIVSIFKVIKGA